MRHVAKERFLKFWQRVHFFLRIHIIRQHSHSVYWLFFMFLHNTDENATLTTMQFMFLCSKQGHRGCSQWIISYVLTVGTIFIWYIRRIRQHTHSLCWLSFMFFHNTDQDVTLATMQFLFLCSKQEHVRCSHATISYVLTVGTSFIIHDRIIRQHTHSLTVLA